MSDVHCVLYVLAVHPHRGIYRCRVSILVHRHLSSLLTAHAWWNNGTNYTQCGGPAVFGKLWGGGTVCGEAVKGMGQPPPLHVGRQSVFMSAVTLCTLLTPTNVPCPLSCTWSVCSSLESSRWSSSPDTAHQLTCTGPLSEASTCHLYW